MQKMKTGWFKFALGWAIVFAVRLVPFRPPNVEPVLATLMPFAKQYGPWPGFLFGALSIALFDIAVGQVGSWTLVTAVAYGLLGVGSYYALARMRGALAYPIVGAVGVVAYDAVTGVIMTPLLYGGMSFTEAFIGQIPFTAMHLASTVALSLIVSPLVERWVVREDSLEIPALAARFGFSKA